MKIQKEKFFKKKSQRFKQGAQQGDSTAVTPQSQSALSKQMMKKWEPWETNMRKSNNPRMLQQLVLHTPQITQTTSTQELGSSWLTHDPCPIMITRLSYLLKCT
jgi:hypothetical protein